MNELKNELEGLRIERDRPAPRRRWPLLLLLPAVVLLAILYVLLGRQRLGATEVRTVQSATIASGEPASGAPVLTASGYVVARRKAVVSAKIQGRLAELRVEEGSHAREGEVIARLESSDYEAQLQRSRAGVERAQADLAENQRQLRVAKDLARDNITARNEVEAAESRVKIADAAVSQARADVSFAEAQLQNTLIRAPFTGVVLKKMAEVGESVAPIPPGVTISSASGAIVALADLATLEVEADVAEANVAKLGSDQPAEVTVEAFPGRRYKAVLRQVIPTADRTKATVQVKVTILDKDKDLKPEMSARVQFLEPRSEKAAGTPAGPPAVMVPKEVVATRDGKTVVFEVREGKVRQRVVQTGAERGDQLMVLEGLAGGETLVARPPEALKDGDRVRVKG